MDYSDKEPNVKEFIKHLHDQLNAISKGMYESKQDYEQIRNDARNIEIHNQEECNDITNRILDDSEKVDREFKTLISEEKGDVSFLKQQILALSQEKMKLEQNSSLLETRIEEVERSVGVEYTLPRIEKNKRY